MKVTISLVLFILSNAVSSKDIKQTRFPNQINIINSIDISNSQIDELIKIFGTTRIKTGSHTDKELCYFYKNTKITFMISSFGHGIDVSNFTNDIPYRCAELSRPIINGLDIEIGMKKSKATKFFGKPFEDKGSRIEYQYLTKESIGSISFDVMSFVTLYFNNNKLTRYSVFSTKTS